MEYPFPKLRSIKALKLEFSDLQNIEISSEEFTIGRALNNILIIPFAALSRHHCELIKNNKSWILKDLSTYGITINGTKLGKGNSIEINHQDIIILDETGEFIYQFVNKQLVASSAKRIRLERQENSPDILVTIEMINYMRAKFEKSQDCEIEHIETKIETTKQLKVTNMTLKDLVQLHMNRKIRNLESNFAAKIENLIGEEDEVKRQKALLIEKRELQWVILNHDMDKKIFEITDQIRKHDEKESALIVEYNLLKEKLIRERDDFLSLLNRDDPLKRDILHKLEIKIIEQEEVRFKEKQEFQSLLQKETEKLKFAKEQELWEMADQQKKRELELTAELNLIKTNLQEQEKLKLAFQQQFYNQLEAMKQVKDENKEKMGQLMKKMNEAQQNAQKEIETIKATISEREKELSATAAAKIQQQAQQSNVVISSLHEQLERFRTLLKNAQNENVKLVQRATSNNSEVDGNTVPTLIQFEDIMESELQCSICAEIFMVATTLNCSHTFCKHCITMWKAQKKRCPICRYPTEILKELRSNLHHRAYITSECKSLAVDSFIEKMVQNLTGDMKEKRRNMLKVREDEVARRRSANRTKTQNRRIIASTSMTLRSPRNTLPQSPANRAMLYSSQIQTPAIPTMNQSTPMVQGSQTLATPGPAPLGDPNSIFEFRRGTSSAYRTTRRATHARLRGHVQPIYDRGY